MSFLCETCLNQHKPQVCLKCLHNPNFGHLGSYYTPYYELCPDKQWNCPEDPGYMSYWYPEKFKELFGDISPREALNHENCQCKNCPWREE